MLLITAYIYFHFKHYGEAAEKYSQSLKIFEHVEGPNSLVVSSVLEDMAACKHQGGDPEAANKAAARASRIIETCIDDPDHPKLIRPLLAQGKSLQAMKMFADAINVFARALAIANKHIGPLHLDVARIMDLLAAAYFESGRAVEAEALFSRAETLRAHLISDQNDAVAQHSFVNTCSAIVSRASSNSFK